MRYKLHSYEIKSQHLSPNVDSVSYKHGGEVVTTDPAAAESLSVQSLHALPVSA